MDEAHSAGSEMPRRHLRSDESIRFYLKPFGAFFEEAGITEIAFNNPKTGTVFVEKNGCWEERPLRLDTRPDSAQAGPRASVLRAMSKFGLNDPDVEGQSDFQDAENAKRLYDHVKNLAVAVAAWNDDDFSDAKPILSATLPKGERVQFVRPPACLKGTISMTIRRPSFEVRTIDSYERAGFFDRIAPVSTKRPGDDELLALYRGMVGEPPAEGYDTQFFAKILRQAQESPKKLTRRILKIAPERIHTMLPGITLLSAASELYGSRTVVTSPHGVREGYMLSVLESRGVRI